MARVVTIASGLEEKDALHLVSTIKPFLSNFAIEHSIDGSREDSSKYSVTGEIIRNISAVETRPRLVIARDEAIAMMRAAGFRAEVCKSEYKHNIFVQDIVCFRSFSEMRLEIFLKAYEVVFVITLYDSAIITRGKHKQIQSSITICHKIHDDTFWSNGFTRNWYDPDSSPATCIASTDDACHPEREALYWLAVEVASMADDGHLTAQLVDMANSFMGGSRTIDINHIDRLRKLIAKKCDMVFAGVDDAYSRNYDKYRYESIRSSRDLLALPLCKDSCEALGNLVKQEGSKKYLVNGNLSLVEAEYLKSTLGNGIVDFVAEPDEEMFETLFFVKGTVVDCFPKYDFRDAMYKYRDALVSNLMRFGYTGWILARWFVAQDNGVDVELSDPLEYFKITFSSSSVEVVSLEWIIENKVDCDEDFEEYELYNVEYCLNFSDFAGGYRFVFDLIDSVAKLNSSGSYEEAVQTLRKLVTDVGDSVSIRRTTARRTPDRATPTFTGKEGAWGPSLYMKPPE